MVRHLGRASLAGGVLAWAALWLALAFGGLDPSAAEGARLQVVTMAALVAALASLGLGAFALVRGPERVAAAVGLALSLFFLLYFTGFGFALAGRFG